MKNVFALILLLAVSLCSFGTHNAAGEIIYQFTSANTVRASIITYTKQSSFQADRDTMLIHWGDGSPNDLIPRTNGPLGVSGVPNGEPIGNDLKKNIYIGSHTYTTASAGSFYIISMTDPNRNSDIINISNPVNVQFYIEDTVWFQNQGLDHSPILLYPPIDFANVGDTFFHNPTAYDVEADSLVFDLVEPMQGLGNIVPGYISPEQVILLPGNTLTIERRNGMVTWASPQQTGIYVIAIMIREYRYGVLLGTMTRDMQIVVRADTSGRSPLNGNFVDTTIIAGQHFELDCSAMDTNAVHINTLTATGGPFIVSSSPATFTSTPANQPTGIMSWAPGHNLYKTRETHIVTICARNNDTTHLTTLRSFRITVVDSSQTAISEISDSHTFVKIYPNPAQDILNVSAITAVHSMGIYSADGKLIRQVSNIDKNAFDIAIKDLAGGHYFIRLRDSQGSISSARFEILR
ncbi:MAG: hypothetical protein JWO03_1899 [Bacteroidetes bacterium]|nr:hypothetical protein [Bacteroidota bacterium]